MHFLCAQNKYPVPYHSMHVTHMGKPDVYCPLVVTPVQFTPVCGQF